MWPDVNVDGGGWQCNVVRLMRLGGDDSAQRAAAAATTAPEWDLSPDTAAWHWLEVTMEIRPVGGLCVCVYVSNRDGRVLIYALQGAAVPSDVGLCPRWLFRPLFTMVTHPLDTRAEKIHTRTHTPTVVLTHLRKWHKHFKTFCMDLVYPPGWEPTGKVFGPWRRNFVNPQPIPFQQTNPIGSVCC